MTGSPPVLEARGLAVAYADHVALAGFDVRLERGRLTGLIGPDGAGKSTAIRALCGLVPHHEGEVSLDGVVPDRPRPALARLVGYMPQRFSLYKDLTVRENIAFFARLHGVGRSRERERDLLVKMGMDRFTGRLAGRLSGGMKQKLALLCVLVHEPSLVIMDEPTTGVDPASRREFWRILGELTAQGMAILVATPYLDEAERCHEVLLMHEGRTMLRGDPDDLVAALERPVFAVPTADPFVLKRRLASADWVRTAQAFGDRLHLTCEDGNEDEESVSRRLALEGLAETAREVSPTLEDVFIERVDA